MNKKSNNFNSLSLIAFTILLGFSLLKFGPKVLRHDDLEAKVTNILERESLFLTDPLNKKLASYLVKTAKDYELDPLLVLAIMKTESSFKPHAVSRKGALGLLQIKPVAARAVHFEARQLLDPFVNVHIGIQYLSHLRHVLGRDQMRILTAYNMGPTRVRRLKNYSSHYARKVLSVYQKYLREYPS